MENVSPIFRKTHKGDIYMENVSPKHNKIQNLINGTVFRILYYSDVI